jgi:predicted phosphodiesterase
MLIQMQLDGWTFSLDARKFLTIHGEGSTITHRHEGLTPDELKGFAQGWVAGHTHLTKDSDLRAAPMPAFQ